MKEELENNETINLPSIIEALLSSLDDKNQDVRQSVIDSIVRISEKNSDVVIQTTVCFWEQHKKMSTEHKISLLKMMSNMCKYISTSLNADLASSVADLAVNELTGETETGAAELLVALSKTHCTQAMGGLLSRLEPGVLPHHALVFTIGKLATANPSGMLSFVKLILTIILPMLNQIREENLKQAICFTTGKLCEAINDCIMNAAEINSHTYQEEIYSVFDILTYNWLKMSRDLKTTEAVLTALVPMMPILPQEVVNENIVKLLPVCLNLCKKQTIRLAAVKVLAIALNNATTIDDKEILHPYMEQIHQTLSGFVSIFPFEATRDVLLTHYEVLQCSRSLVILYPEEGLERTLQQVRSSNASQRARALIVLKHLINTLPPEDDGSLNRIALTLQESLGETSALQMVGAIVALAARPTFSLSSSQRITFIRYMVSHCGVKNNDTEAYSDALHLLATTVNGAELWLWPCLIDVLLDSTYVASAASVLRALSPLAAKIISSEISSMPERDFPGTKVLARCLELLGNPANRFAATIFLKVAAPLVGHRLKPYWDKKLSELAQFLQDEQKSILKNSAQRDLIWEEKVVEWLEESVKLEGNSWGTKLADELALKSNAPGVAPLFALLCNNHAHIILLVEHARSHGGNNKEYARAVGICAKRHLSIVLKVMDEFCTAEDTRKVPVRILGFMKDFVKDFAKAADATETAKAGLLQSYAEIAQRADPENFFPVFEEHVLPWTVKHLTASKELSTKEAGLSVLEQLSKAVHPTRWAESKGLHMKGTTLALLMGMLQSSTGYRPLQLYPAILKAAISIIRIPPILSHEENEIFLTGILDKTIGATTEIVLLLQPDILQQVTDELGILSNEIISDSADMLATLIDILLPWMQTKSSIERKITLLVLDTVLRSYYNSIKYTYPSGKFDAGKLVGRTLSWFAIAEFSLRPLVVDCVFLSLNIACRHRSIMPDTKLDEELKRIKTNITTLDKSIINEVMESLAKAVSERIPSSEIIGLAEGLIEGLLFGGEAGLVVGIALSQHFKIKGSEMSRNDVGLVDNIVTQMRHMENANCRTTAAAAIVLLMAHHPEEVIERMLLQPLPLDRATELCWKEIGNNDLGHRALELLLIKLEANNLFSETTALTHPDRNNTASFQSLTTVIALKHLLQTPNAENLIEKQLPKLLSILLKYLAGWLQVDAPAAVMSTKYGYVPNLEARKIKPHAEVYSVLSNVLIMVNPNAASTLLKEIVSSSTTKIEENVVSTVRKLIECVLTRNDVLSNMAQSIGKLMTSTIAIQRAVAATFYAELIGKVDCGVIWLDAIINTLYEAKADSSSLVRTLATTGLSRIAYVDQKLIDVYFDNCMDALLDGLEEPASGEGGSEVVLESLRGLAVLLSVQSKTPISPRVVMALKPFIEKENVDMKFAAISVLGAIAINWQTTAALADDNDLSDHLLWCLPCLIVRLEDANILVAKITQETLYKIANILQCEKLSRAIRINLGPQAKCNFEAFTRDLINCLKEELPQRAEELRNAVVRGYSRSENHHTRATSALLLGLFGSPRSEDIQRLLQLLNDKENIVKIRASRALSCCFSF